MRARFSALTGTAKIGGGLRYFLPSPPQWGMEGASFGFPLPEAWSEQGAAALWWNPAGDSRPLEQSLCLSQGVMAVLGNARQELRTSASHSKVWGWQAEHLPAWIHPWWQKCQDAEHCMRDLKFVVATICILLILIKCVFSAYFLWDTSEVGLLWFWVFSERALI